ncbi:MAG: hypothetical protein WCK89_10750 [bacterium]
MKTEEIMCPKCNTGGTCEIVPRVSHFNLIAFLAGGIILSLLWSGSLPTKLKCGTCDYRFLRRTPWAKASLAVFWILIVIIGLGVLAMMFLPE